MEHHSPLLGIVAMVAILVATLSTNVAANVVAPANSFANLSPQRVSFRTGGLLAGLLGIAILPWKLLDMYQGWLISYSGLLGAVGGVIMCDYLVVRRGRLVLADLYRHDGGRDCGGLDRLGHARLAIPVQRRMVQRNDRFVRRLLRAHAA